MINVGLIFDLLSCNKELELLEGERMYYRSWIFASKTQASLISLKLSFKLEEEGFSCAYQGTTQNLSQT